MANNRERGRHPTTNWRRRQRRSKTNEPSQGPSTTQDRSPLSNQSQPTPPEGTDPPHSSQPRRRRQHNRSETRKRAKEAGKLQRWYRANKKKCIRSILGEQSPRCEIPLEELTNHFSVEPPPPPTSPPPTHLPERRESYDPDELTFPVEPTEVHKQLKRLPSKSAPGPDGVTYNLWKSSEVTPTLLATVYSICCLNKRVPATWKTSNTILIYKKGDPLSPRNWRPISLQPTVYKIYAAILARRLVSWAIENKVISSSQKGLLPFEGCAEHSFILRSVQQLPISRGGQSPMPRLCRRPLHH